MALRDLLTGPSPPGISLSRWRHVHKLITSHSDIPACLHEDRGIGLDFPAEPPAGMAEEPVPSPTQPPDQAVTVTCPNCGKTLNAPKASAGRTGRCPACNTRFLIAAQLDAGRRRKAGLLI